MVGSETLCFKFYTSFASEESYVTIRLRLGVYAIDGSDSGSFEGSSSASSFLSLYGCDLSLLRAGSASGLLSLFIRDLPRVATLS